MQAGESRALLHGLWSTDRSLTLLLCLLSLILFVLEPMGGLGLVGRVLVAAVFSLALLAGVGAIAGNRRVAIAVGLCFVVPLTTRWVRVWAGGVYLAAYDAILSAMFTALLAVVVLALVVRQGPITRHRLEGAVAVYLLIALSFAFFYEFMDVRFAGAFQPLVPVDGDVQILSSRFVYFSLVTLTTVGYGDITAVHPVARAAATLEALIGQLYPAILLARLVSMQLLDHEANRNRGRMT